MRILPEAKQLANEYPLSEEEVNDYVLTGLPLSKVRALCDLRASGASHEVTYAIATWARDKYFARLDELRRIGGGERG